MLAIRPPIILLTSDIEDGDLSRARQMTDRILQKPVNLPGCSAEWRPC